MSSERRLCTGTAFAGLDAEENKPYQLHIIVGFSNHPLLTQVFKDEVKREIQGSFEAALGGAGVVEVLDTDKLRENAAQQKNASAAFPGTLRCVSGFGRDESIAGGVQRLASRLRQEDSIAFSLISRTTATTSPPASMTDSLRSPVRWCVEATLTIGSSSAGRLLF